MVDSPWFRTYCSYKLFFNEVIILINDSYSKYNRWKSSSFIIFLLLAMNKQETTSIPDLKEYVRKFLKTALLWPVLPSAIFSTTESAARFICGVKTNNSSFGKLLVKVFTSSVKSNALFQTCKLSNL